MFERYTQKARRVIFFARYEASHYGSPQIETEHLLLGLLREEKSVSLWVPKALPETIRQRIDAATMTRPPIPTNVDLPLSTEARRVLGFAAEEADRLANKDIGTQHLLLALLDEDKCFASNLLRECDADAANLRIKFSEARPRGQP
jgi:ATP-dependent Clp protease ATP-binding subunit ClpC